MIYKIAICLFLLQSCAVNYNLQKRYNNVENFLYSGNYIEASKYLDKEIQTYSENDLLLYYLDKGLLEFYAGNHQLSINHLDKADQLMENLYTKSISQAVGSMFSNDYALAYSGEDYENLYVNIFKALSYIKLGQNGSALVEIRRFHDKITLLKNKYAKEIEQINNEKDTKLEIGDYNIHDNAIARYLSYILYRADDLNDDARIDLEKMLKLWDDSSQLYDFEKPEIAHFSPELSTDSARLNVLVFSGLAPVKKAWELQVLTFLDHIIITGKPNFERSFVMKLDKKNVDLSFKLSIPTMKKRDSRITNIKILINGQDTTCYQLESIDNIAINTFGLNQDTRLLKHFSRSLIKAVAANETAKTAKKSVGDNIWGQLLGDIGKALINETEQADLRAWRLLPQKSYMNEFKLPFGTHTIKIVYYSNNVILKTDKRLVELKPENKLNMVMSYAF
jgi:uncharacterized protein